MKQQITLLIITSLFCAASVGQSAGKRDEINYSDPFQIDSSDYFLIPKLIDNDNKDSYGKGKGYLPWNNYSEIYFYNTTINQSKKLFNSQLALILPFIPRHFDKDRAYEMPGNILDKHIVYLARTENFNRDNGLDTDDPVYFYISGKTGEGLTQITPKGMNVISWTLSKNRKFILVKLQQDKNGNKKFGEGDDEVYYRIDLNEDISQTKCYPISLK